MASDLAKRIAAARRIWVAHDGMRFRFQVPTVADLQRAARDGENTPELLARLAVDWDKVRECDMLEGGSDEEIPFDREAFAAWVADVPELWAAASNAMAAAREAANKRREEQRGNSPAS